MGSEAAKNIPAMIEAIQGGRYIYADALRPTADETLHDLGIVADTMAQRLQKGDVRFVRVLATYEKGEANGK